MRLVALAGVLAPVLALASCATPPPLPASANASFDPIAFFTGRTHGEGTLDKLLGAPVRVRVDSVGRRHGDVLILEQTIREGDKQPRVRRWRMRRVAPDLYSGTLTDANSRVQVRTAGPRAYISYTMDGGLEVDQQLALQSDGRTVLNRLEVKKLGVRVATLNETIRKVD